MTEAEKRASKSWDIRIDLAEREAIVHWTRRLGCSEHQLREAVRAVGPVATAVRRYLGR